MELGFTALHMAAASGCTDAVRLLVDLGCNKDAVAKTTRATPLHAAVSTAQLEVVKCLLELGADSSMELEAGVAMVCPGGIPQAKSPGLPGRPPILTKTIFGKAHFAHD